MLKSTIVLEISGLDSSNFFFIKSLCGPGKEDFLFVYQFSKMQYDDLKEWTSDFFEFKSVYKYFVDFFLLKNLISIFVLYSITNVFISI